MPQIIFIFPVISAGLMEGIASPYKPCFVYSLGLSQLQQYYQISSKTSKTRLHFTEITLAQKSLHHEKLCGKQLEMFSASLHCCVSISLHNEGPVSAAGVPCVLRP